jgi:hypothetical protein
MNAIARRIAAGTALLAAAALIALGTATMSQADTSIANNGPLSGKWRCCCSVVWRVDQEPADRRSDNGAQRLGELEQGEMRTEAIDAAERRHGWWPVAGVVSERSGWS